MRTHAKIKYRAPGFIFFADKLLAQTEHLDEGEFGIYWRMCCRIWLFTPTQFSFEDREDNWRELSGIESSDRIQKVREKFLKKLHPLFMRSHNKHGNFLIQNGLRKAKGLITKKSAQNSANARKRWKSETSDHTNVEKTRMRTHVFGNANISISSLKKACVYSNNASLKDKDSYIKKDCMEKSEKAGGYKKEYREKLSEFLSDEQIGRIEGVCNLSLGYVEEKIRIMRDRKAKNPGAFLYAALTQNYLPTEEKKEFAKRTIEHPLIKKARQVPLNETEFGELSDKNQKRFKAVNGTRDAYDAYKLISKPVDGGNAITRAIFETIAIGSIIDKKQYDQLWKEHKKHFEKTTVAAETVKEFHLLE